MTAASSARRYANVLFDITQSRGIADRALADLTAVRDVVASHPDLRHIFDTPVVAPQKKRAILDGLLAHASIGDEVRRTLALLADRDRLVLLPAIAAAFSDRVMRAKNILPADVVTAVPLTPEGRASLASALSKAVGSDVTIHERVDPDILGGMIARVGSLVFDGSVTRQIERLREQLAAE